MTESTPEHENPAAAEGEGHYDVVLLVEQALSPADARQVRSLHEGIEEPVRYHLVLPVEDAAAAVEAAMGSLTTGEMLTPPAAPMAEVDLEAVREQSQEQAADALTGSVASLKGAGAVVGSQHPVDDAPVDALARVIDEVGGREAIILTRPHVVAEFFHLDWASRARRSLGVPVLHLLEHETFDEQAGGPEGVTGF